MCGIIGYIGEKDSISILTEGLSALEYRGYDSAGVAFFEKGSSDVRVVKAQGRLQNLSDKLASMPEIHSGCGIGHTRWATHGVPSDINAHPHKSGSVCLVHNGIIENYADIKNILCGGEKPGYEFVSETDTEAAAALMDYHYKLCGNAEKAIRLTVSALRGSYAFGVIFDGQEDTLYAARRDSPLIIGLSETGNFIASDVSAILRHTKRYIALDDGETAVIKRDSVVVKDHLGDVVEKEILEAKWDVSAAEKGGYPHFMLKEIAEEPDAVVKTLSPRIADGTFSFDHEGLTAELLCKIKRLRIVACGTAMHAGLLAKPIFEKLAGIPVQVQIASEFRYSDPLLEDGEAVMIISQSGETADSLAALRLSKSLGALTIGMINVIGSSIAREADVVIPTYAGPEIAVASTKAYTVQTALLFALAVCMANAKNKPCDAMDALVRDLPAALQKIIDDSDIICDIAHKVYRAGDLFFIGRGIDCAVAEEASLKLKEISYIHSEAYPAGELKHGTISLITEGVPVIAISTAEAVKEKLFSNIREAVSRGGQAILIRAHECAVAEDAGKSVSLEYVLPEMPALISSIAAVTVTQLFAYHTAVLRGCDVDKPRNLAKSVTVE